MLPHSTLPDLPTIRSDLRIAAVLGLAAAFATAALFPYLLLVMPQLLAKLPATIPFWVVVLAQSLQAGLLLALLSLLGLRMGHRVGLGAPWLNAWLAQSPRPRLPWPHAVACGLAAGALILSLDPLFAANMPAPLQALPAADSRASAGVGFLASFYGGIAEELQLRLFLMSLVVWLLAYFGRRRTGPWMFWLAIVITALLFGAGHLPAAAQIWPLEMVVVMRTLLLNGIAGLIFGWLYWKRGLEMAMVAHFSADLVLHVLAPLFFG